MDIQLDLNCNIFTRQASRSGEPKRQKGPSRRQRRHSHCGRYGGSWEADNPSVRLGGCTAACVVAQGHSPLEAQLGKDPARPIPMAHLNDRGHHAIWSNGDDSIRVPCCGTRPVGKSRSALGFDGPRHSSPIVWPSPVDWIFTVHSSDARDPGPAEIK